MQVCVSIWFSWKDRWYGGGGIEVGLGMGGDGDDWFIWLTRIP